MARVQSKIRDNMDGILESAGFFRKHVAAEPDSLYRAVADVLLGSQVHKDRVALAVANLRKSTRGEAIVREEADLHRRQLRLVAVTMGAAVRVVSSNDAHLGVTEFEADGSVKTDVRDDKSGIAFEDDDGLDCDRSGEKSVMFNGDSGAKGSVGGLGSLMPIVGPVEHGGDECRPKFKRTSSAKNNLALLCFTPPSQYDPIYDVATIESAGFVQSMLYELLYQRVLDMPDAMWAADEMLNGDFDPQRGKPDFFDADFKGSAMDALRAFKIPFPYKVAKTLDPNAYRNIEYDVWHCDKKRSTSNPASPLKRSRNNNLRSIGRLKRGTPCIVRDSPTQRDIFGLVDGIVEEDKRYVYVHVPSVEVNIRVLRKCVLPLKELPTDVRDAWANYSMPSVLDTLPTCQWGMDSRSGECHGFRGGSLLPQLHTSAASHPQLQYDLPPLGLQFSGQEPTHSLLPFSNTCRRNELLPAIFDRQPSLHSSILPPGVSPSFFAPRIESGGYMQPSSPYLPSPLALGNSFIGSLPTPQSENGYGWNGGYQFFQYPPASPMIGPSSQVFLPQMQPPVSPFDFTHLVQALNQGN